MDWTDVLAVEAENERARLAAELLASAAHGDTAVRVKAFMEQGGGCRATFFNYRRKLAARTRAVMGPDKRFNETRFQGTDQAAKWSGGRAMLRVSYDRWEKS